MVERDLVSVDWISRTPLNTISTTLLLLSKARDLDSNIHVEENMEASRLVLSSSRPKIVLVQQADELRDRENILYDRTLSICTNSTQVQLEIIRKEMSSTNGLNASLVAAHSLQSSFATITICGQVTPPRW